MSGVIEFLGPVAPAAGRVLTILAAAAIAILIVRRLVRALKLSSLRLMQRHADGPAGELERRAVTVAGIIRRLAVGFIIGVALVMVLREVGLDITPILAGAGVAGLAVGFGAQNLVRDVIAGFFMLIENQVRVNDIAVINGTGGLVEEMNLRTTVLRSADGAVHVFPNGSISSLSNLTREFSYYLFELGVSYAADTDHVVAVIRRVAGELSREAEYAPLVLEPLEVQGVDRFMDSAVIIRARIRTVATKQWVVGRELNRRFKKAFDEEGIEIPFPQRTVHVRGLPETAAAGVDRDAIRRIVREVLAEGEAGRDER